MTDNGNRLAVNGTSINGNGHNRQYDNGNGRIIVTEFANGAGTGHESQLDTVAEDMQAKLESPELLQKFELDFKPVDIEAAQHSITSLLHAIGEDPNREGLKETPKRYLKFMDEFLSPPEFNFTAFDAEGMDEMITQTDIPFYSLCEHHIAPFFGVGHIAYIPNGKIVGLSKLARTLETYSARLQNQERITQQVADRLMNELNPLGVAVVLKAQHLCMAMRGVKKHDVYTTTSKMVGIFKEDDMPRHEFMSMIQ